ncbi:GNAT family N-acetyltransferase [Streptomyces sp. SID13031]|uniref:GNAT family N-acetyltransferase n=1 Tax=Streptomyces sp. SID13031 TaxID=2706046 RepID=UPI0013C5730F|nr:GNAT family N-acetyltransferase [Streptomyces sp. SID13031]NEA33178.1 GNAT family N-acetyltransferase [Streptomyces sp. SID13031]
MTPKQIRFVELSGTTMAALLADDLPLASREAGVELTDLFTNVESKWLWNYRIAQLEDEPEAARWIVRAAVSEPEGIVIGHGGFHGPPDENGMVEVGYTVDEPYRRQGYAKAILTALIERAAAEPGVRIVRASISPTNAASLATIAGFGFLEAGEQWDEEDGLELLFERPL